MKLTTLFLAAIIFFASGCQILDKKAFDPTELQRTWNAGRLLVPASASRQGSDCVGPMREGKYSCHQFLDTTRQHPVIIFMHDCIGKLTRGDFLGDYAVTVSLDSFARTGRQEDCDVDSDKKNIITLRFAEISYAIAQLKKLEWVDSSKIYLAGFSEGAAAVALYHGEEDFAGRIIYGWGCTGSNWWTGINGPRVPVLAVIGSEDHYLQSANKYGRDCGLYFSDRSNSKSIVIEGAPHNILRYPETRAATKEFIETINRL